MTPDADSNRTLIIGAGLSGLVAAKTLSEAGRSVLVVDKGRSVGGRLATRRMEGALLDHGAQFFTTRSAEFTAAVAEWTAAGVTTEWCRGFGPEDGYPRYVTNGGMNQLAKHLASQLDSDLVTVVTKVRAQALLQTEDGWGVSYESGARDVDVTRSVIATAPVPQTIDLLIDGATRLDGVTFDELRAITYHGVVGLLTLVDQAPVLGPAGALQQPENSDFTFVADNQAKGISQQPAVTFHVAHALSAALFEQSDDAIAEALLPKAQAVLGSTTITAHQVKKWRYAGPVTPYPERCLTVATTPGPLVLAGDAFGSSKVEGAFLSGLAAAEAILATT